MFVVLLYRLRATVQVSLTFRLADRVDTCYAGQKSKEQVGFLEHYASVKLFLLKAEGIGFDGESFIS